MKNKKIIGVVAAASLVGLSASFAKQTDTQSQTGSPRAQDQQSDQSSQSSQSSQTSQAQPPSPAGIQDPAGASTGTFDKENFIKEAAKDGMAEVNMGQMAQQKGQDPQIKELGQRLVADHSKANGELKELAQKKGITLSTESDSKTQKMMDHLSGLSGAEFDKAFATHAVKDHKKGIAKFEQAAASDDADIKQFAQQCLPKLKEHLAMAQKIAPETSAGATVEEPAGAEKPDQQNEDSSSSSSQDSSKSSSSSDADKSSTDSSQSSDQSTTPK